MDTILNLEDINELYEDRINHGNLRDLYNLEHKGSWFTYKEFVGTRCNSTTETIRYLISDDVKWNPVKNVSKEVYQVSFVNNDDEYDDDPIHSLIVCNGYIYQSFFGLYLLRKKYLPNIQLLLQNVEQNWTEITDDLSPFSSDNTKIIFLEPTFVNFDLIETKYSSLKK
jgi:hypothetical protein